MILQFTSCCPVGAIDMILQPPGTGKTKTIVEAVKLLKVRQNESITCIILVVINTP